MSEIDLQCREQVASDTESEAENNANETGLGGAGANATSTSAREPVLFPQQRFGSPSSISQSSTGSEITHRPKAIKAKYAVVTFLLLAFAICYLPHLVRSFIVCRFDIWQARSTVA